MYFRYFVIISPLKRAGPFIWKTWIPFTQGCFVPSLVEIGSVVLKKKIFKFVNVFSLFRNYLPFGEEMTLHLNILDSPWPKEALCAKFGWKWPSGSGEEVKNRKSLQTDRRTVRQTDDGRQVIRKAYLSFKLRWAKKNRESLHPRMLCAKIGWNWPGVLNGKLFKFRQRIFTIS